MLNPSDIKITYQEKRGDDWVTPAPDFATVTLADVLYHDLLGAAEAVIVGDLLGEGSAVVTGRVRIIAAGKRREPYRLLLPGGPLPEPEREAVRYRVRREFRQRTGRTVGSAAV